MKHIVTGGAGFIGSHLVDRLIDAGDEVMVIDNLSTGKREFVNAKAKFIEGDIVDKDMIERVYSEYKPDYLHHLAAQIDVRYSFEHPIIDAQVNIIGTLNLIESARRYSTRRIIFASSGGTVYGEPDRNPVPESYPNIPVSPYGMSKLVSEKYLDLYKRLYGLNYVSLRLGNVFGPRQSPKGECGVFSIFALKMLKGERPTIYGDGTATRDYIFVDDVIDSFIASLDENIPSDYYNIGRGEETSTKEVYDLLAKVVGYSEEPIYSDPRPGEVYQISLDISKAKENLKWEPKTSLEEGVRKLIEYIKEKEFY